MMHRDMTGIFFWDRNDVSTAKSRGSSDHCPKEHQVYLRREHYHGAGVRFCQKAHVRNRPASIAMVENLQRCLAVSMLTFSFTFCSRMYMVTLAMLERSGTARRIFRSSESSLTLRQGQMTRLCLARCISLIPYPSLSCRPARFH